MGSVTQILGPQASEGGHLHMTGSGQVTGGLARVFFPRLSFIVLPLAVSAQDLGLIWSGHMKYRALGMCAGYALNVHQTWHVLRM